MRVESPKLNSTEYNDYLMSAPGWGGLNITDLEYDIEDIQSPDMLNMMVKDGALSKRYGQSLIATTGDKLASPLQAIGEYNDTLLVQAGNNIYSITNNVVKLLRSNVGPKGNFHTFNKQLLFMNGSVYLAYDDKGLNDVVPYIPDIAINMKPDGTGADLIEDYNRLGAQFKNTFSADGTSKKFKLLINNLQGNSSNPKTEVVVGTQKFTYGASSIGFTVDWTNGIVILTEAPPEGINNVVITATMSNEESIKYIESIKGCKYMCNYGGNNNSRLFVAGNGSSIFFYSDVFDASYFPESQYANIGNGTDDITGFGEQYSTLMVFKPDQVFGVVYSYDEDNKKPSFDSYTVNALIGCDCPNTISMVNNQLTWLNSTYGVCSMISTSIKDEKNIVYISRNINRGMTAGLLDDKEIKESYAFNYDGKYWVCLPCGDVYVWDYELTPYSYSGYMDKDALRLSWFKFDNMVIRCSVRIDEKIFYGNDVLMTLDNSLVDYIHSSTSENHLEPIRSHFKTKMLDFGYIDYLKTIKRMYVDVRGDTPSLIRIKYITGDNPEGEYDLENIVIYSRLWNKFTWDTFGYGIINFKKEFARNVSLKKINIFGVMFENDQIEKDMSISSIKLKWFISQKVR